MHLSEYITEIHLDIKSFLSSGLSGNFTECVCFFVDKIIPDWSLKWPGPLWYFYLYDVCAALFHSR